MEAFYSTSGSALSPQYRNFSLKQKPLQKNTEKEGARDPVVHSLQHSSYTQSLGNIVEEVAERA